MQSLIEKINRLLPMSRATDNYKLAYKKALNDVIALIKQHEASGVDEGVVLSLILNCLAKHEGKTYLGKAGHVLNAIRPYLKQQQPKSADVVEVKWRNGWPPHPWDKEWFIAETTYGDRVVLRALPEEYSYDFKTADETYIKKDKIKRWMQFPDSAYVAPLAAMQGETQDKGE